MINIEEKSTRFRFIFDSKQNQKSRGQRLDCIEMITAQGGPSNLSQAILASKRLEKNFLETQYVNLDRDRNRIRSKFERHMETFLQMTRKRHETWHRYDRYFREALKKDKDRHEKRKQRLGSATDPVHVSHPSLITINSRPEPVTKLERRTYQVLQASQKLLDESAMRSEPRFASSSRPSTTSNTRKTSATTAKSSTTFNSASLIVPMTQSIDFDEYQRLMNESLARETYADFVEHFIKFRPEFREQFAYSHLIAKRHNAVTKLKEFNHKFARTQDERYENLIHSLHDFRLKSSK